MSRRGSIRRPWWIGRPRLGLSVGADGARCAAVPCRPWADVRLAEYAWDPEDPEALAASLREDFPGVASVAVALELPLLHVKRLDLPPLPADEKRRTVRMEPGRYFPVRGVRMAVAARAADGLVFALEEERFRAWCRALEAWKPLERAEPAAEAVARALAAGGVEDALVVSQEDGGLALLSLSGGALDGVRRLRGRTEPGLAEILEEDPREVLWLRSTGATGPEEETAASPAGGADRGRAVEPVHGVPPRFLGAYGAALGWQDDLDGALLASDLEERIVARRRRSLATAAAAVAAAALFAVSSADAYRDRAVRAVDRRLAAVEDSAAEIRSLQDSLAATARRRSVLDSLSRSGPSVLRGLAALTRHLPDEAYLERLEGEGDEWEIEGFAAETGAVVRRLEGAPELEDVRFVGATRRRSDAREGYESFHLALRLAR